MKICPYCQTNNGDYDVLCKSCYRILDTSPDTIRKQKEKEEKKKEQKKKKKHNKTDAKEEINWLLILAIIVRVLAIITFFIIFHPNTTVNKVLFTLAILSPMVGDFFGNFIILLSPIILINSNGLSPTQSIVTIILFILYIPVVAVFSYGVILERFKNKKMITTVIVSILFVFITITSVIKLNTRPSVSENSSTKNDTIQLNTMSSYVSPGESAYISIIAEPNTKYNISVEYKSGYSDAEGLIAKTSSASGFVSWRWVVGTRTYPGTYPITISSDDFPFHSETFYFTVK